MTIVFTEYELIYHYAWAENVGQVTSYTNKSLGQTFYIFFGRNIEFLNELLYTS